MGVSGIRSVFVSSKIQHWHYEFEFDSYQDYLSVTNKHIEKRKAELKDYNNIEDDEVQRMLYDPIEMLTTDKMIQIYYSSMLISLYSFWEQSLQELCLVAEQKFDLN